jgi:serine protease Do
MDFNQNKPNNSSEENQNGCDNASQNGEYSRKADEIIQEPKAWQPPESNSSDGQPKSEYVSGENQKPPVQQPYTFYQQWQNDSGNAAPDFNTIYGGDKKKKKNNKPVKIVVGVLVCAMLFGGGVLLGVSRDSGQTKDSTPTTQTTSSKKSKNGSTTLSIVSSEDKEALTSSQVYAKVSPSVVSVVCTSLTSSSESSGSGVVMSKDGYIITNQHVIADADKITVVMSDSTQYQAELIGSDEQTDLAVLKVDANGDLTPAEFGDSDELQVGDLAYAIGSPGGVELQNTFTSGMISAINRDITVNDRVMTLIQTDASINPGNSGGALINNKGQVIGITNAKLMSSTNTTYEGLGFAIPIDSVQEIVDELIVNGHITGRPAIGISGYNISEDTAKNNDVPQGVLVQSVDSRSDAYTQGVQKGDIIVGVNGKTITSMDEINTIKEKYKAGDSITLNIYRAGKNVEIKIKLMDQNDLSTQTANDDTSNDNQQSNGNGSYYYQFPFSSFFGY